ncbi:MAG: hypothetical protein A2Y12_19415, partial [Planctomycetes bacterium GWF2_42_9]
MLSSCEYADKSKLPAIVKQQIDRYPDQRLIDIYKTFFQGFFGPAHLISDFNDALQYTNQELSESNEFENYDYCELPPDGKFVRLNLKLVKEGKMSAEDFTKIFVASAKQVSENDIQRWKKIWPKILAEIEKQKPNMKNFEEDKAYINSLLAQNKYVVHHSEDFVNKYHPHYRV